MGGFSALGGNGGAPERRPAQALPGCWRRGRRGAGGGGRGRLRSWWQEAGRVGTEAGPVRAVVGSDKAAAPTQPAAVEKSALPVAAVEPVKPQPAVAEKPEAPALAEKPRDPAESKPAAAEKVAAPAERPARREKAALAPSPTAERPRPVERRSRLRSRRLLNALSPQGRWLPPSQPSRNLLPKR